MIDSIFIADIEEEEEMNKLTAMTILGILSASMAFPTYAVGEVSGEVVRTAGTITAIAAYYEAEGEVTLEVSANGGSTYTKITNGTIIKDGFIPGNQLCYRANIPEASILHKVVLGYKDTSGASTLYQNPDLKNYQHRKEFYISGAERELFNYPVKVAVSGIRYQVSGENSENNVYFTAADGQTPLYYYQEDVLPATCDVQPAIYYVKLPQIPPEGTKIYVYYSSVIVSPAPSVIASPAPSVIASPAPSVIASPEGAKQSQYNDPNRVFAFFDDFNSVELDTAKWALRQGIKEDYAVKDGYLRLSNTTVISKDFRLKDAVLEFKAKADKNASIQVIVRGEDTVLSLFSLEQLVYSSSYPGAEHTIAINDIAKLNLSKPIKPDTEYIYKVRANASGIIFERYSADYKKEAIIQFMDIGGLEQGYIGLKAGSSPYESASVYFDYIRVRPYGEIEPMAQGLSPSEGR